MEHLGTLRDELAALQKENDALRMQLTQLEASLKASKEIEGKMKRMLQNMESTSATLLDQSKNNAAQIATRAEQERRMFVKNAQDEAELIIRDAERRAGRILEDADRKRAAVVEDMGMLHGKRMTLIARFKSLVSSQLEFLKALEHDVKDPTVESFTLPSGKKTKEGVDAEQLEQIIQHLESIEKTSHDAPATTD